MSKKKKVKDRPEVSDRSAPPPSPAPTMQLPGVAASTSIVNSSDPAIQPEVPTPSVEDLMRDTTNAMSREPLPTATPPGFLAATNDRIEQAMERLSADGSDEGPLPDNNPLDDEADRPAALIAAGNCFAAHLEACSICYDHPQTLCEEGLKLLHAIADDLATDLGAITADRYRLILALERAAVYGHGLDSDRALHMEAAAMIRSLLDLAPDADLTQPYTTGPVVNDPPIGDSL